MPTKIETFATLRACPECNEGTSESIRKSNIVEIITSEQPPYFCCLEVENGLKSSEEFDNVSASWGEIIAVCASEKSSLHTLICNHI